MELSDRESREAFEKGQRAQAQLERQKTEEKVVQNRALVAVAALGTGAVIGAVNAQKGGTPQAPYSLGGKIPLDTAFALGGVAALFMARKSDWLGVALGFGGGSLGVWGARLGFNWEQARLTGTSTASTTATTSGRVGFRGGMAGRFFGPGAYGPGDNANPWVHAHNPYVTHYAGPAAG